MWTGSNARTHLCSITDPNYHNIGVDLSIFIIIVGSDECRCSFWHVIQQCFLHTSWFLSLLLINNRLLIPFFRTYYLLICSHLEIVIIQLIVPVSIHALMDSFWVGVQSTLWHGGFRLLLLSEWWSLPIVVHTCSFVCFKAAHSNDGEGPHETLGKQIVKL